MLTLPDCTMNNPAPPSASIQLASTGRETGRLHVWLDQALEGAPEAVSHAVRLCLEEAVMNVVMHGYGPDQPGAINVRLWPEAGCLVAEILDDAAPFGWTKPLKRAVAGLADAAIGG